MTKTIFIKGMMCDNCKKHVENALNNIEGIQRVEVSLEEGKAIIEFENDINNSILINAIKEEGYEVEKIN